MSVFTFTDSHLMFLRGFPYIQELYSGFLNFFNVYIKECFMIWWITLCKCNLSWPYELLVCPEWTDFHWMFSRDEMFLDRQAEHRGVNLTFWRWWWPAQTPKWDSQCWTFLEPSRGVYEVITRENANLRTCSVLFSLVVFFIASNVCTPSSAMSAILHSRVGREASHTGMMLALCSPVYLFYRLTSTRANLHGILFF